MHLRYDDSPGGDFMAVSVQELYQQAVLPLPERERLELMALIIKDLTRPRTTSGAQKQNGKKLSDLFGMASLGYPTGVDNEQIDADLAREYASTHEDKN
jgi:hypothetical protein